MAQRAHATPKRITGEPLSSEITAAFSDLEAFIRERRGGAMTDFLEFEKRLHAKVMGLEREIVKEEFERADLDVPAIVIEGQVYRQVLRAAETYQTASGEVRVMRSLYKDRSDEGARAVVPMEYRLGLIEGRWTPLAAQEAVWVVAHMTPKSGQELFARFGNMEPSKASLDRLPKQLSSRWEEERERFEEELRMAEVVPDRAATVAVSLDGVMAPMKDGEGPEKRAEAAAQGQQTSGPAGYREVGCGTVTFYDEDGHLLRGVRIGRMPEPGKATLKTMLVGELGKALAERPDLRLVALADGAKDNWTFLEDKVAKSVSKSVCILDFYHAAEHLSAALGAAYGEGSVKARANFEKQRLILLEDPDGVEKVIRSVASLRKSHPRSQKIEQVLGYLRDNRHRMRYADYRERGIPIGSGVVESACKTLVTQRMKNSGMRWSDEGGQAILTSRSWCQSDRFDRAWALLSATYRIDVRVIAPVIELERRGTFQKV